MSEYPERPPMYAIQYAKWLFSSGAANEVGPDATALLIAVVTLEDEFFYQRSPNFYNAQLMFRCGMASEHSFIRARKIAIDAKLLNYQPGKKRTPGRYFVIGFTAQNAAKAKRKEIESQEKAKPSIPIPKPIPKSKVASLFSGMSFDEFWKAYPTRDGRKVGKADAVKAFAKINEADHVDLIRSVKVYAASGQIPKDASRFLKDNYWRDWITSPMNSPDSNMPAPQAVKRRRTI